MYGKEFQAGVDPEDTSVGDPQYMTIEEDGQEAFDAMWRDVPIGDNGYLHRPISPGGYDA